MRSIGRDPIFIASGSGSHIKDVDGNTYIDWVCSWGPLILGHGNPQVLHAITHAAALGSTFGAPTEGEVVLAEEIAARMPSVEMVRMTSSGTEASMSAIRLARAVTGREKLLKFAGAYHGHVDGLLAQAGSGIATQGLPGSPGVTAAATATTITIPWNDDAALEAAFAQHEFAAVLFETVPANMGVVPAKLGYLAELAAGARRNGALLVADEVITGLPRRPRRRSGVARARSRPDDHGQDRRWRPARRRLRWPARADAPDRACRRRLPGGNAVRQPAGGRGRVGDARAARRRTLTSAWPSSLSGSP